MNHDCSMQKDVASDKKVFKHKILGNLTFFNILNYKFSTPFLSDFPKLNFWPETWYQNYEKTELHQVSRVFTLERQNKFIQGNLIFLLW